MTACRSRSGNGSHKLRCRGLPPQCGAFGPSPARKDCRMQKRSCRLRRPKPERWPVIGNPLFAKSIQCLEGTAHVFLCSLLRYQRQDEASTLAERSRTCSTHIGPTESVARTTAPWTGRSTIGRTRIVSIPGGRSCRLFLSFRLRAGISGVLWKQADDSKPPAPRDRHATCVRQPGKPLVCAGVGELRHDRLLCLGNCHRGNR